MNHLKSRKLFQYPQVNPIVPGNQPLVPEADRDSGGIPRTTPVSSGAVVMPEAGVSAGADVNKNGFVYSNEDAYQRLLQQAASPGAFRYNPNSQVARNYADIYRREGNRATANALAQAAAATGGVPSSYAVGAAQQAGAYYASQLADKQAELEQQAYNRYLNERAASLQGLEALGADRADAYNKYLKEQELAMLKQQQEQELAVLKQQQEQLAAQEAAKLQLDNSTGVSQATIKYVSEKTNGTMQITDPYWWEELLADNTEEQLKAAGITYTGP